MKTNKMPKSVNFKSPSSGNLEKNTKKRFNCFSSPTFIINL